MTPEQRSMLRALSLCTMLPASYEKRFVRNLVSAETELTSKQAQLLTNLYWRYRRQILALIEAGRNFAPPIEPPPPQPDEPDPGVYFHYAPEARQRAAEQEACQRLARWNAAATPKKGGGK